MRIPGYSDQQTAQGSFTAAWSWSMGPQYRDYCHFVEYLDHSRYSLPWIRNRYIHIRPLFYVRTDNQEKRPKAIVYGNLGLYIQSYSHFTAVCVCNVSPAPRVSPSWWVSEQWAAGGHTVGSVAMVAKVRCNTSYCQHQHPHTSTRHTSAVHTYNCTLMHHTPRSDSRP